MANVIQEIDLHDDVIIIIDEEEEEEEEKEYAFEEIGPEFCKMMFSCKSCNAFYDGCAQCCADLNHQMYLLNDLTGERKKVKIQ
jgi:hypothetical protein